MRIIRSCSIAILMSMTVAGITSAQEDNPHIGYVYPAGGQQGTTFEVLLGGQHSRRRQRSLAFPVTVCKRRSSNTSDRSTKVSLRRYRTGWGS